MLVAVLGLLLVSAVPITQQQAPPQTPPPIVETGPDVDILHHLRRSTVSLGLRIPDQGRVRFVTVGSAVIVAWDAHNGCLLTAKHIFFNPDKGYAPTIIYARIPQSEPRSDDDLGVPVPLVVNGQTLWHASSDADLAVIGLPDLSIYKDIHGISLSDFGDENDVYQGASVVVFGYPELLGPDYQTTPIARGGIVAWTNPNGRLDHTFLVDANVFSGNSGGPVFHLLAGTSSRSGGLMIGGTPKLIGIVSKDAGEEATVHAGPVPATAVNPQTGVVTPITALVLNIGGIGIVEPASKAKALITTTFNTKPAAKP